MRAALEHDLRPRSAARPAHRPRSGQARRRRILLRTLRRLEIDSAALVRIDRGKRFVDRLCAFCRGSRALVHLSGGDLLSTEALRVIWRRFQFADAPVLPAGCGERQVKPGDRVRPARPCDSGLSRATGRSTSHRARPAGHRSPPRRTRQRVEVFRIDPPAEGGWIRHNCFARSSYERLRSCSLRSCSLPSCSLPC